jgi:protein phosphatase
MKIEWAYFTNRGKIRAENQDALFINGFGVIGDTSAPICGVLNETDKAFFCVVDGAGGHSSGETASRIVVAELVKRAEKLTMNPHSLSEELSGIQETMTQMSAYNPHLKGMAAALAGVFAAPGAICSFNVGDCRAYVLRWRFLKKITHDHSLVQILRDNDVITEDEMRFHPDKNRITSALKAGVNDTPKVYWNETKPENSEIILICSDGVWESLSAEEIEKALSTAEQDFAAAANELSRMLIMTECGDNVSFIILKNTVSLEAKSA